MFDPIRVFISGPMSGYEDWNKSAFMEAEEKLNKAGFSVFNPAWMNFDSGWSNEGIMAIDLVALSHCNYIYQLEGWKYSKGASAEYTFALASGIKTINEAWLNWYIEEKEKRVKDFEEKFEKNRLMWQRAATKMKEEQEAKYMSNIAAMQTALYEKGGLNEQEIEKGEYKSARPSDRPECSEDGHEEKRCAQAQ